MFPLTLLLMVFGCIILTEGEVYSYHLHMADGTSEVSGIYLAAGIRTNFKENMLACVRSCFSTSRTYPPSQSYLFQSATCTICQNEQLISRTSAAKSVASTITATTLATTQAEERTSVLAWHVTAQPVSTSVTNVWDSMQHVSSTKAINYADKATQQTDTFSLLKENVITTEGSMITKMFDQFDDFVTSGSSPNTQWTVSVSNNSATLLPPTTTESEFSNPESTPEANVDVSPLSNNTLLSTFPSSSFITNDTRATTTSQPFLATPNEETISSLPTSSVAAVLENRTSISEAAETASAETGSTWSRTSSTTTSISNLTNDGNYEKQINAAIQKVPGSTVKIYRITNGESGVYAAATDGNVYYRNSTNANSGAVGDNWLNYGNFNVWNVTAIVATKYSCLVYTNSGSFLRVYGESSWLPDSVYFNSNFLAVNNPNTKTFFGINANMNLAAGFFPSYGYNATWTVCDTGGLSTISFGAAGLWAITKEGALYYMNNSREADAKCRGEWITTAGKFHKVAAGKRLVLALSSNGILCARTGLSALNPVGSKWASISVGVNITDIAVSATDLAWLVSDDGETYTIKNVQTLL